ncbi:hypothetical protein RR48_09917 [Papilio machaon]|uniref:DUF4774 domain-containing protein n=1 Tax=Papilio machaon TaxID=76193 RepID=A0A194RIV4_PAPMA|nr:hypothetical protein RR48_09917 [Papilio machaon]
MLIHNIIQKHRYTVQPSTQTIREETRNKFNVQQSEENNERSLSPSDNTTNSNTDKILEQIETINQGLSDPDKQNVASSRRPQTGAEYIIDEGTFDKIQQIVASIKPRPFSQKQQVDNYVNNVDDLSQSLGRSKALRFDSSSINNDILPAMPLPYITTMPVMIIPSTTDLFNTKSVLNSLRPTNYLTRQDSSSFPFQFQWPLASFFPILVKDPLLGFLHGGGWNNFFDIGQSADVCSRRQKSHDANIIESDIFGDSIENRSSDDSPHVTNIKRHARVTRSLKKRNIPTPSPIQNADNGKKSKKVSIKPLLTRTKTKKPQVEQEKEVIENDGDLRFPFSDFTWFGNKKPVAPSPGFFINKMKVRRGGVAIAGPGGVATAGRGGTAIVGPGGLAYTQPGGLAVAGPAARVIALSPYTDLTSLVSRLHQQSLDGSMPRSFNPLSEGRLVATGPVIYYHPYYNVPQESTKNIRRNSDTNDRAEYYYNGMDFEEGFSENSTIVIHLKPRAHALTGPYGIAIANPISQVIVGRNKQVAVAYDPEATAVAGPGGIAHAQASTQYLPFYGGAKGQYLEVQKDTKGFVVSEKIVAEESISSENIVKNNDDSLLTRVLATNLLSLRTLAGSALKLLTLGRRTGALNNNNRARFRTQLTSLSDTASNTVGEEGDEGISVDAPEHDDDEDEDAALGDARIAEAKPIGLAVIGETGLAAARPVGTAVATSGVALARPVGTAIAGINPALLGIDFQINQLRRSLQPRNKKH